MTTQLRIYNHRTGDLKTIITEQKILGLSYEVALNDIGRLAATFAYDATLVAYFALDDFVEVWNDDTGTMTVVETYLYRTPHYYIEDDQEFFGIGAVSLNHLLLRRIVHPADDPSAAGGYVTRAGEANSVLENYAYYQLGAGASAARQIPNLTISTNGTAQQVGDRVRFTPLLDLFEKLSQKGQTDFRIVRSSSNNLVLQVGNIGSDKTYATNYPSLPATVFSPQRGDLKNPSLRIDRDSEANFVFVLGEGEGASQTVYSLAGNTTADSAYNRIEFTSKLRKGDTDTSPTLQLLTDAVAAINDNRPRAQFDFEVVPNRGATRYRIDWDIGDTVTVKWREQSEDLRVVRAMTDIADGTITQEVALEPANA